MKAVILILAALVAQSTQQCSNTPTYTEKIDPVVCPKANILLPNYENVQNYYSCSLASNNSYIVTPLECGTGTYFSYVLQSCQACSSYLPTAKCGSLPYNASCVAMDSVAPTTTTEAPGESTTSSTTTTTVAPTTTTTEAPGETTTTSALPEPSTESPATTTTNSDDIITPSGTTVSVPQPPSPTENDGVPTPVTPAPTAPNLNDHPPTANAIPSAR
ncbi:peritrophin-55 [Drosophila ficusphila]|uniref:peritrophin-55 n=1 Tax=Drosophila ficusphila TaxID=30025 RepID=UPI0007E754BD|nr:peritrophin-55 [Drosophila ficusphila]